MEYILGIHTSNIYYEYIRNIFIIFTESELDSATSNDADLNGNKFCKDPKSKLSTNTGNIFPSDSNISSLDTVSSNLSRCTYQDIKCCSSTTKYRKCRKTIHWNRHKIVTAEDDLNLKTIQDVCLHIYSNLN